MVSHYQAGIDRANQQAATPTEWIDQWELKTTCLSFQTGEIEISTGAVNKGRLRKYFVFEGNFI